MIKVLDNEIHQAEIQKSEIEIQLSEILNPGRMGEQQNPTDFTTSPPVPPIPQMIIDLEKSIKAKDSPAYSHWTKIFNLKQAAQTLLYIQEQGFTDMESLQQASQSANDEHADIEKQIREIKDKSQKPNRSKGANRNIPQHTGCL